MGPQIVSITSKKIVVRIIFLDPLDISPYDNINVRMKLELFDKGFENTGLKSIPC